jgi:HK97 family phage prohead protease
MSETELLEVQESHARWATFTRQTPLELAEEGDGRTLYGRVVPYGVVANVADPPHFNPYRESFVPGAFRAQLQAANRIDVLLNYEHRQGISDVVGRGVALDDQPDGLYGTFRMLSHADGDKALELYHAGILRGLSTEFSVRKSRTVDGVVQRVDARIGNVALCREFGANTGGAKAAYPGAEVLNVRAIGSEQAADAVLRQMLAAAMRYVELEPDPEDKLAMRQMIKEIRALIAKEEGETVDPAELSPPAPAATSGRTADLFERLSALGIDVILSRAVVRKPWDGSPARFTDEEYQRSCLIDRGGDAPVKDRCSLPVLEPNGDVNANALASAAGRLGQVAASQAMKAAAARKLMRYYRMADMTPPASMTKMAG